MLTVHKQWLWPHNPVHPNHQVVAPVHQPLVIPHLMFAGVTHPLLSRSRYLRPPPTHFLDRMVDAFGGLRCLVAGQGEDEGHENNQIVDELKAVALC